MSKTGGGDKMKENRVGYTTGIWLESKPLILNDHYNLNKTEPYEETKGIRCGQYTMKDGIEVTIDLWREAERKFLDIWVEQMDLPGKTVGDFIAYLASNELIIDPEVHPEIEVMAHSGRYIAQVLINHGK